MATPFERIREIIATELSVGEDQVVPAADLYTDLGGDSLDVAQIAMKLEEELGIALDDEDILDLRTVQQILDRVAGHLEAKV